MAASSSPSSCIIYINPMCVGELAFLHGEKCSGTVCLFNVFVTVGDGDFGGGGGGGTGVSGAAGS